MLRKILPLALLMVPWLSPAMAETALDNPIIAAPERPLFPTCYRTDTDTLSAALLLEEIEGDAIDVMGFGTVTTAEGDSWGFTTAFTGLLDGAFLTGQVNTLVEAAVIDNRVQWAFVDGGLVTDMGTFAASDCDGIEQEFIDRSIN